jgi:hypothetical protein
MLSTFYIHVLEVAVWKVMERNGIIECSGSGGMEEDGKAWKIKCGKTNVCIFRRRTLLLLFFSKLEMLVYRLVN